MLSAPERTERARVAAYAMHARHDPTETTRAAREALLAKYLRRVDPDGALADAERYRRANAEMRADLSRLALQALKAKREQRERREAEETVQLLAAEVAAS